MKTITFRLSTDDLLDQFYRWYLEEGHEYFNEYLGDQSTVPYELRPGIDVCPMGDVYIDESGVTIELETAVAPLEEPGYETSTLS